MKHIIVYTTQYCGYCESAKRLLQSRGYAYEERFLSRSEHEKWQELADKTGYRKMPQIFIGDQFIGGFDELNSLDRQNKLKALVEEE